MQHSFTVLCLLQAFHFYTSEAKAQLLVFEGNPNASYSLAYQPATVRRIVNIILSSFRKFSSYVGGVATYTYACIAKFGGDENCYNYFSGGGKCPV